jgi:hypothetical protein
MMANAAKQWEVELISREWRRDMSRTMDRRVEDIDKAMRELRRSVRGEELVQTGAAQWAVHNVVFGVGDMPGRDARPLPRC